AVIRMSGPTSATPVRSRSMASVTVGTPAGPSTVDPAPSSLGATYPTTSSTSPAARNAPASVGPPSSRAARTPRPYSSASSLSRSTRPAGSDPSSAAVATQVGAASLVTRASAGVLPAESTITRSGRRTSPGTDGQL